MLNFLSKPKHLAWKLLLYFAIGSAVLGAVFLISSLGSHLYFSQNPYSSSESRDVFWFHYSGILACLFLMACFLNFFFLAALRVESSHISMEQIRPYVSWAVGYFGVCGSYLITSTLVRESLWLGFSMYLFIASFVLSCLLLVRRRAIENEMAADKL